MKRKSIRLVTCFLFLLSLACASTVSRALPTDCTLRIDVIQTEYATAGDVRIRYEPTSVTEIAVLTPWDEGFFSVDLKRRTAWERHGMLRSERSKTMTLPISWGIPTSVWNRTRERVAPGRYELPPGRYQLVMKYQPGSATTVCFAATEPFTLTKTTSWVSTEAMLPSTQKGKFDLHVRPEWSRNDRHEIHEADFQQLRQGVK